MKKLLKPEMEFIKFNTEDVITTSGGDTPAGGGKFNFPYGGTEVTPDSGSPANQKDWGEPTFNF